jgi:hypothetical protein
VLLRNISGATTQVAVGGLPQGIYSVSVFAENGQLVGSKRIVLAQ